MRIFSQAGRSFGPGTVSRDAVWSLAYTAVVRLGTAALSVVVARMLGAAGAGALGVALQVAAFGMLFATLNLPAALTRHLAATSDPRVGSRFIVTAGGLVLGLGAVAGIAILLLAGFLARNLYGNADLAATLAACGPLILCGAGYLWVEGALQGMRRFGALARWGAAVAVLDLVLVIPAAGAGVAGVLIARAGVRCVAVLAGWLIWLRRGIAPAPAAGAQPPAPETDYAPVLAPLLAFSGPTLLGAIATLAGQLLLRVLLVRRSGLEIAGHLQAADSMAQGLLLVPLAATAALMPAVSRESGRQDGDFAGLLERGMAQVTGIHLSISLAAMAVLPWLLELAFGRDFSAARPVFVFLAAAYGLAGPGAVFGAALTGRGELWTGAVVNTVWAVVCLAAFQFVLGPLGAVGAAVAIAVGYLTLLTLSAVMLPRRWRVPWRRVWLPIAGTPVVLAAAVALCVAPGLPGVIAVAGPLALAAAVFAGWTWPRLTLGKRVRG